MDFLTPQIRTYDNAKERQVVLIETVLEQLMGC